MAAPFVRHALVGWLHGLLQTAHTALPDPHVIAADWSTGQAAEHTSTPSDIPSSNHFDHPHAEPTVPTSRQPDDIAPNEHNPAIRSARQTLITAITGRITQYRLNAAQAAAVLDLTGPKVTQLLQANVDEFTLDELVSLLPALELTIEVVPRTGTVAGHPPSGQRPND